MRTLCLIEYSNSGACAISYLWVSAAGDLVVRGPRSTVLEAFKARPRLAEYGVRPGAAGRNLAQRPRGQGRGLRLCREPPDFPRGSGSDRVLLAGA